MLQKIVDIWLKYGDVFLKGLGGTLWISAVTVLLGTVLGMLIALLRLSKFRLPRMISGLYIEILRGTPILLQLYFFWLWLPEVVPLELSNTQCVVVALVVNASAYVAEVIRAGIQAVDPGQTEAAKSLGMSNRHMMTRIIMPQAIKNILPALCNEFIVMIKETSLASVFFVNELTTSFKTVQSVTFQAIPPLIIIGIIYLVLTALLSRLVKLFERRLKASD